MPVKVRLMRIGSKKRPFYRIVAVDERNKRTGKYIELIGTYNPLTEPKDIVIKQDLLDKWVKQGAVLSSGFLRITKQAPQKPPRKPKKAKEEKPSEQVKPASEPATPQVAETSTESTAEAQQEEAVVDSSTEEVKE